MTAIRLAERRGKFQGDLSPVQDLALTMIDWHEMTTSTPEARMDMVRAALVASGRVAMENLFPEYAPESTAKDVMSDGPSYIKSSDDIDDARSFLERLDAMTGSGSLSFSEIGDPSGSS
jgi:hypothetical protein